VVSVDPELAAGAGGPVTTTVTRQIKPGHEAAYEAFLAGISGAARTFPGYLGIEIFRPTPGGHGGEYRTVPTQIARHGPHRHRQGISHNKFEVDGGGALNEPG
jgi:hypothetical protein